MAKVKREKDTSMAALTLHRDYPIFHADRQFKKEYILIEWVNDENGELEVSIIRGCRSLDGKDLSIFHYLLTALKHNSKGKADKTKFRVQISLKKLCEHRGIEPREQNLRGIENSITAMMNTTMRLVYPTNEKMDRLCAAANGDVLKLVELVEKVKKYVTVPIIQRVERNNDIMIVDIAEEYIESMENKTLFFESIDMQKLSSVGTIAYEKLQIMVGGVDNKNEVKKRSFREDDFNRRMGWDRLNDTALRKRWSLLNKEWQEKTSLPEWRRKTIDGVVWRVPKERKFDIFSKENSN